MLHHGAGEGWRKRRQLTLAARAASLDLTVSGRETSLPGAQQPVLVAPTDAIMACLASACTACRRLPRRSASQLLDAQRDLDLGLVLVQPAAEPSLDLVALAVDGAAMDLEWMRG